LKLFMKSLKSLFFAAVILVLVPTASSAVIGDILCGLLPCEGTPPPAAVPEPSGALVMGAALLVLAVARRARK
jgi:hypothetical protein